MIQLITLLPLSLFVLSGFAKDCYGPDGSLQNSTISYQCPTTGSSQEAMCCRSMDSSGASGADRCVPVGATPGNWLCQNDDGSLWRRGCSDKSWKSPGCVNICADQTKDYHGNVMAEYDEQVTPCQDGSYCCGPGTIGADCCAKGNGAFIVNGSTQKQKPPSSSTDMPTATVTVIAAVSGTAAVPAVTLTMSNNNNNNNNNNANANANAAAASPSPASGSSSNGPADSASAANSNGKVIGGAVGGAVAGILIMLLAEFFLFRRLRQKRHDHAAAKETKNVDDGSAGSAVYQNATAGGVGGVYTGKSQPHVTTTSVDAPPYGAYKSGSPVNGDLPPPPPPPNNSYWQTQGYTTMYEAPADRDSQPPIAELGPGSTPMTPSTAVASTPSSATYAHHTHQQHQPRSSSMSTPRSQRRHDPPHELPSPTSAGAGPTSPGLTSPSSVMVPLTMDATLAASHSRSQSGASRPQPGGELLSSRKWSGV